jgi:hypothetical protein
VLTAESLYPDVPRIILLLVVIGALAIAVIWLRSRSRGPAAPEPPVFQS